MVGTYEKKKIKKERHCVVIRFCLFVVEYLDSGRISLSFRRINDILEVVVRDLGAREVLEKGTKIVSHAEGCLLPIESQRMGNAKILFSDMIFCPPLPAILRMMTSACCLPRK